MAELVEPRDTDGVLVRSRLDGDPALGVGSAGKDFARPGSVGDPICSGSTGVAGELGTVAGVVVDSGAGAAAVGDAVEVGSGVGAATCPGAADLLLSVGGGSALGSVTASALDSGAGAAVISGAGSVVGSVMGCAIDSGAVLVSPGGVEVEASSAPVAVAAPAASATSTPAAAIQRVLLPRTCTPLPEKLLQKTIEIAGSANGGAPGVAKVRAESFRDVRPCHGAVARLWARLHAPPVHRLLYYYPRIDDLIMEVSREAIDRYAERRSQRVLFSP